MSVIPQNKSLKRASADNLANDVHGVLIYHDIKGVAFLAFLKPKGPQRSVI